MFWTQVEVQLYVSWFLLLGCGVGTGLSAFIFALPLIGFGLVFVAVLEMYRMSNFHLVDLDGWGIVRFWYDSYIVFSIECILIGYANDIGQA